MAAPDKCTNVPFWDTSYVFVFVFLHQEGMDFFATCCSEIYFLGAFVISKQKDFIEGAYSQVRMPRMSLLLT